MRVVVFLSPILTVCISSYVNHLRADGIPCELLFGEIQKTVQTHNWASLIDPEQAAFQRYLDVITFPDGVRLSEMSGDECEVMIESQTQKSYTPVCFLQPLSKNYNASIEMAIRVIRGCTRFPEELYGAFTYIFSELSDNIAEHSNYNNAVIFVQNFPKRNIIYVTIADFGFGCLESYRRNPPRNRPIPNGHVQALEYALSGVSSKGKERGFGMSTSIRVIGEGLKGIYRIFSGNAGYTSASTERTVFTIGSVYGWRGMIWSYELPTIPPPDFKLSDYYE